MGSLSGKKTHQPALGIAMEDKGMEQETSPGPETLLQDPKTAILVACMHARSRSKAIAAEIRNLGYADVGSFGAKDYDLPEEDRADIAKKAQLVVASAPDVKTEIQRYLKSIGANPTIIAFYLSEREHQVLRIGTKENKDELKQSIRERLLAAGFVDFKNTSPPGPLPS